MKAALDGVKRDGDGRKIDGLRELFDAANDGKAVAFTVRIGGRKAVKSAEMKYVG